MKSWWIKQLIVWLFFAVCMGGTPLFAYDDSVQDTEEYQEPQVQDTGAYQESLVQVMLGAVRYSNLNLDYQYQSPNDENLEATSSFTWMPQLGISGAIPIVKKPTSFGIEGGVLFSWKSESVTAYGRNNTINIHIDNQLYLLDLFIGPYLSAELGKKVRVYGGLGPLLMYGQNNNDQTDEEINSSGTVQTTNDKNSSAFGPGLYARTGIEFRLKNNSWMGVGVRGFMSRLNFDNVQETTDINGIQLMLTYSIGIKPSDDDDDYIEDF
jgi:hypothetical protein